jgi:hypothetical protein
MIFKGFLRACALGILFCGTCMSASTEPSGKEKSSVLAAVEKYVLNYYEKQQDYSPEFLITREQTQPLLDAFRRQGWKPSLLDDIASRLVSEEEFLSKELDSTAGKKFMKQIAKYPQHYDCLDRLSRLPLGHETVRNLINYYGGEKMIELLTTNATSKDVGKMLAQSPNGAHFNEPTGRIYTATMLVDAFREAITGKQKK